ncbi:MAG: FAD-dependent oxidoreductase [Gammaproteobacteria bacterium]
MQKNLLFILLTITLLSSTICHAQTDHEKNNPEVIVIGAGISGLAAANYLVKQHIPVLVLEARNRIGGRIDTVHSWGPGLDLGASWIHGINNNPIALMAKQQHLSTTATHYADTSPFARFESYIFYDAAGKKLPENQVKQALNLAHQFDHFVEKNTALLDNKSIEDAYQLFIQQNYLSGDTANLLHYIITVLYIYEFSADLHSLSANAQLPYNQSVVSGKNVIFSYGYSQILPALTKNIPIELNQRVKKINYGKEGVDIYTDTAHYQAKQVIITVPLGVLKSGAITFTPTLPAEKLDVINKLDMAVYNKIFLFFDHPFWDTKTEWIGYIPKNYNLHETVDIMNYYKYTQQPILLMFTGGSRGAEIEHWSDQQTITYLMSVLKKIYGENIPKPSSYFITRWNTDPLSYGAYSYLPAGVKPNYYAKFIAPVNNQLFFAGEATSTTDPSTVHGAYLTGIRAAKQVLAVDR